MTNRHIKKIFNAVIIREMQIKTKCDITSQLPEWLSSKSLQTTHVRMWNKGALVHCLWECKLVHLLWKTICSFLKKLKRELRYDPGIPLLVLYSGKKKKNEKTNSKKHMDPKVLNSTIYNSQNMDAIQVTINRKMHKK